VSDGLDPADWSAVRAALHRAVDDIVDDLATIRERPAWQPVPDMVKSAIRSELPRAGVPLELLYGEFRRLIAPYPTGNLHPRFFGWVHGAGTAAGILGELLAAGMDANVGGREHAAVYVERAIVRWFIELFGFPDDASGLLTTGTSAGNLLAAIVAREALPAGDGPLTAYVSSAGHDSVVKAMRAIGLPGALRAVQAGSDSAVDLAQLRATIAADRLAGARPFLVIANAGTVDTGAFDPLDALADLCRDEGLWLHVDGAFGALAALSPAHRHLVAGIERADSLAFDAHKWLHAPYDVGCLLVRDERAHRAAFATRPAYLVRTTRGTGAGDPWYADYGLELSRGFRALKLWFTLRHYGFDRLGEAIAGCCLRAQRLAAAVDAAPDLERTAPTPLNIVVFRHRGGGEDPAAGDAFNQELAIRIQESGEAVVSTTRVAGRLALRVCVLNHRTTDADVDRLLETTLRLGATIPTSKGSDSSDRSALS
jgi:glutamate/tyrosine decarboxylase-like PLP-dependent enzyme